VKYFSGLKCAFFGTLLLRLMVIVSDVSFFLLLLWFFARAI
jgi:hypothetical protein